MASSKKKQSEGIALLSMYNDEEDDEMEDVEEDEDEGQAKGQPQEENGRDATIPEEDSDRMMAVDSANEATPAVGNDGFTPDKSKFGTSAAPQLAQLNMAVSPVEQERVVSSDASRSGRRGALTIVDYGHDEVAMSPEHEEGEIDGSGRVMFGEELQAANGDSLDGTPTGTVQVLTPSNQANTPQFSEQYKSDAMNHDAVTGPDGTEHEESGQEEQKFVDPLDKFLPPPPKDKCSEELQRKINKFLDYKKAGKSFNAEVRNRKDYRNPDFLLHAVRYQDIDQIGSCFCKDVFDPHGYDPCDFYDEIEADMRRESDRKEQERKKAQKVEFVSGGAQPGIVAGAPRVNMSVAGTSAGTVSGLHLVPPTAEAINRDGRQNKKSKWDK